MVRTSISLGFLCVTLAGCGVLPTRNAPLDASEPVQAEVSETSVTTDILVRPQARPDGLADAKPEAETIAAPEISAGTLGRTVASLGNAAKPGLWLETPLVQAERSGSLYYPATNKTVRVTLIPIDGPVTAGSRISLQAMQELGAPLTGLPEIDVLS